MANSRFCASSDLTGARQQIGADAFAFLELLPSRLMTHS